MGTRMRIIIAAAALALAVSAAIARAPSGKDVMQPVDTSAGSMTDPNKLLEVNLDRPVQLALVEQPAELAFIQLGGLLGIEWGYMPGVNLKKPITVSQSGPARDLLKALGQAALVRFEVTGPTQMRVFPARAGKSPSHKSTPPPIKHD